MEGTKAGAQISRKAFLQSVFILLALMLLAGILTRLIPAGSFDRSIVDGRETILPDSFHTVTPLHYPIWRWLTAPLEVLAGPDGLTIATILIFLLMVGASFAILDKSGILRSALSRIIHKFGGQKYLLLLVVSFFFMAVGAFFGIFEEVVPLIPLMLALAHVMGWDSLVGLGMSILATNLGFSAAVTNPFTIGVAQKLAGLPLFSGAWFRILIFLVVYAVFAVFLVRYARRIERDPASSPIFKEDQSERIKYQSASLETAESSQPHMGRAITWFGICMILILAVLIGGPFISAISAYTLPLVGILFLLGGLGAGAVAGMGTKPLFKAAWEGLAGIAPGVPLILMAASIKFIAAQGQILDTILNRLAEPISRTNSFTAVVIVYLLALLIEFFIGSGSAKAFLMMPILLPLADLVGLTRQTVVTAYCFGDGFSNLAYPTNPVLLIALGLTVVSYPKWLRWSLKLWFWIILATLAFLGIAVAIHLGPF
jgi:uncharacterized ion transporter superfamily protein YfcC